MAGTCRDIHEASEKGEKEEVERFIMAGVDVDKKDNDGQPPIRLAAQGGHTDTVKLLLDHDANIHEKDEKGWPLIYWASGEGHTDIVKLFLDHGANIKVKNKNGSTSLHQAARKGQTDTVKLLLDGGAYIHEKTKRGETPLMAAAEHGHIDTVKLLLEHGAVIDELTGHTDTVRFLLSEGADPYITDVGGTVIAIWRDILKHDWSKQTEEKILSSYSSKENYKVYIAAALALNKQDFLMKFIKKVSEKRGKLVDSFLSKNAEDISNLLAFIRRHATTDEDEKNTLDKNIQILIGGEGKNRFYLVKTKALGDKSGPKSLLQYIVDNGPRMIKQREELLDVLVNCVENVNSEDKKEIELKIINNLKLGLPSSPGLAECIAMTGEKFPWSKEKAAIMVLLSIFVWFLSYLIYLTDVGTDLKFADDMWNSSQKNFTSLQANCTDEFYNRTDEFYQFCNRTEKEYMEECLGFHEKNALIGQKCREIGPRFEDPQKFIECYWYSLVHVYAPFVWAFLVFVHTIKTMKKENICGMIFNNRRPLMVWKLFRIPLPPCASSMKMILEGFKAFFRTRNNFQEWVLETEVEIADSEDFFNLSSGIEAAMEACPQFFFQTVYFLPNLIVNLVATYEGWKELVSHKMLSIAISFTSVAVSNYFIRWDLLTKI